MDKENKSEELEVIRDQLMAFGNSLSGDETGNLAVAVHRANNILLKVQNQLNGYDESESKVMPLITMDDHTLRNILFVDDLR